jgi:hypothetical protein
MDILNIIDKLELIKHYHLINVLEKYTEQVAATATATAPTAPVVATTATAAPVVATAATAPVVATAATAPVVPPVPPVPPVPVPPEEAKKPPAEFESNMMDSLKWVFIGIAIFVFILIILSVVYWLMFGGGSNSNNASTVPTDATANTDGVNGDNEVNGMNAENEANAENGMNAENEANAEMNYNPPPEPYQEPIEDKESSMFSSLSSMSPFSSSKEPIVEPIAVVSPEIQASPLATPEVIPESPLATPEGVVPINVIEEVKK